MEEQLAALAETGDHGPFGHREPRRRRQEPGDLRRVSRRVRPEQAQRAGEPHQPQTRERRAGPSAAQRALHPGCFPRGHQPLPATTLMSLNIGRYMAISMPPTIVPMTTIITGSMTEVSVSTAASTSSS